MTQEPQEPPITASADMTREELVRHLEEAHHIDPISERLGLRHSDQSRLGVLGVKGDLASIHNEEHEQKQATLDHRH
jgi:hypothetical protein